jgi:hypothetical protein
MRDYLNLHLWACSARHCLEMWSVCFCSLEKIINPSALDFEDRVNV